MTMTTTEEEAGKLFVGGLSWETTKETLQQYFSRYGEVVDCVVMKNNESGRSRGFGFVTFKDQNCVSIVLATGPHELDGRTIDPKACTPRSMQKGKKGGSFPKIFLGGLPPSVTETDIRNFFSKYGKVIDVVIMYDQEKKRSRGFGFLSFESDDGVDQVCSEHFVTISGKQVECKRAEPRDLNRGRKTFTAVGMDGQWGASTMAMPGAVGSWGGAAVPSASPEATNIAGTPGTSAPVANGMMTAPGYQASWAAPQQQTGYAPQAAYGAQYQGWGAMPAGYGGYAPGAQYGQQPYPGYAPVPGFGYGYAAPMGASPAPPVPAAAPPAAAVPAGNGQGESFPPGAVAPGTNPPQQPGASGPPAQGNPAGQATNPYGAMGNYAQEASGFGPARYGGASAGGGNVENMHGYMAGQGYAGGASTPSYGAQGDNSQNSRGSNQSQGYHPYRR